MTIARSASSCYSSLPDLEASQVSFDDTSTLGDASTFQEDSPRDTTKSCIEQETTTPVACWWTELKVLPREPLSLLEQRVRNAHLVLQQSAARAMGTNHPTPQGTHEEDTNDVLHPMHHDCKPNDDIEDFETVATIGKKSTTTASTPFYTVVQPKSTISPRLPRTGSAVSLQSSLNKMKNNNSSSSRVSSTASRGADAHGNGNRKDGGFHDDGIGKEETSSDEMLVLPPLHGCCDWGFFVDSVCGDDASSRVVQQEQRQARKPTYRRFLRKELQHSKPPPR